ncbi:MAG: DUF1489 domain-containing protein [Pseudomonadota bacterium]
MPNPSLHLIKLCVGAERVEDLLDWQKRQAALQRTRGLPQEHTHVTRMWPRRSAELLQGGSLFWVFKGYILARQGIARLDRVIGEDGVSRCSIVLDKTVIRTHAMPRKAFQGWRYLDPKDAPPDLPDDETTHEDALPAGLSVALADIGIR